MNFFKKVKIKLNVIWNRPKLWKKARIEGKRLKLEEHGFVFQSPQIKAKFFLPYYESEFIQAMILTNGTYYEYNELQYVFKEFNHGQIGKAVRGHCILDIGSNIGNHTLYFLMECDAAKVHCFEPIDVVYNILLSNIELNSLQNRVELHHVAVGAKSAMAKSSHFNKNNMGATEIKYNDHGDFQVIALDDMQIEDEIRFIKIDIEGFEYEALQGMKKTIQKYLPYMIIEINDDNFQKVISFMHKFGYKEIKIGKCINYLFIPPNK